MAKKSKEKQEPVTFQVDQQQQEPAQFIVDQPKETEPPVSFTLDAPPAQSVKKIKGPEFQCPECDKIFILAVKKRPAHIRCPYCGLEGIVD
jgi:hypothetical protein